MTPNLLCLPAFALLRRATRDAREHEYRDITQFIMEMLRDRKEPIPPEDLLDAARCVPPCLWCRISVYDTKHANSV